jgi:hypothetical protein
MRAVDVGVVSKQGRRASMEDSYCLTSFYVTPFGEEEPVQAHLAAVFDGHRYYIYVCVTRLLHISTFLSSCLVYMPTIMHSVMSIAARRRSDTDAVAVYATLLPLPLAFYS